jgi:Protein of unknown function (DUF2752)
LGVPWLVYTRLYFWLQARGLTVAPSLFMHLTGRPDPLCGLTRTFAWMWRGDLARAALVYPLGPILFLLSFPLLIHATVVILRGTTIRITLPPAGPLLLVATALLLVTLNWISKLAWLGV